MNLFPSLPVLEELKKNFDRKNHNNIYIVSVQHLLETTGSLFEAIIDLGINPSNIYLLGKIYSTHDETMRVLQAKGINVFSNRPFEKFGTMRENLKKDVASLWEAIRSKLKEKDVVIILDDGGLAIRRAPKELFSVCKFYGIEQTTFGLRYQDNLDHFPIIQVATSAAKKLLEPNLISRALIDKIHYYLRKRRPKMIGIIGFGNIGKAVAFRLSKKYKVLIYDNNSVAMQTNVGYRLKKCSTTEDLIKKCDVIIGATGVDISKPEWDILITSDKTFISVSSGDIEFNTILRKFNEYFRYCRYKPLDNLVIPSQNKSRITVFRGGTAANFNRSKESCPKEHIQLTRGLLFAGILQAINNNIYLTDENGSIKLKPSFQKIIVEKWFAENPKFKKIYPQTLIENFSSENWIAENSGGK